MLPIACFVSPAASLEPAAKRVVVKNVRMRTLILLLTCATVAHAQDPVRDLLPDGDDSDPIGTGDTASLRDVPEPSSNEPPEDPTLGPAVPTIESSRGEVLWAIPGIREVDHEVDIELADGMAVVDVEMRFISRARHAGEVRYRLPVPDDAIPVSLEVCRGAECRRGIADEPGSNSHAYFDALRARGSSGKPIGHVSRVADALVVRAAPVDRGSPTSVRLRWVARAPVRGGVARLRIPGRGNDLRVARASVRVSSSDLIGLSAHGRPFSGTTRRDAWEAIEVAGNARSGGDARATLETFACGDGRCARARVVAGPRPGRAERFVVMIDASPSTLGPSRGRMHAALASLFGSMPAGSTVRVIAFAGRAEALVSEPRPPSEIALTSIANAPSMELGSATRFEAAWGVARGWGRAHLIVVGDGGLTTGEPSTRAFAEAARRRVRLSVLNIADRPTSDALRRHADALGGAVVDAGTAAGLASREAGSQHLEEALLPLFAPRVTERVRLRTAGRSIELGALYAGEELHWEGPIRGATSLSVGSARERATRSSQSWVAARGRAIAGLPTRLSAIDPVDLQVASRVDCHPRGPARRASGVGGDDGMAPAEPLMCAPAPVATAPNNAAPGRGVPAETLLQMLRGRIVPIARGCFRRDRAGRVDYSRRATFVFRLADREVTEAEVEGEIDDALRTCLMNAIDVLDVPYFEGEVAVRYPLYTEPGQRPPRIEIQRRVLDAVDRVAGDEPSRPSL